MTSHRERPELSPEELEEQEAEELPDREVMSVIRPGTTSASEDMPTDLLHGWDTYPPA